MKKRILALLMALAMTLALAACGGSDPKPEEPANGGDDTQQAGQTAGIPADELKIGLVLIGDQADAYSFNHIVGMEAAMLALDLDPAQLIVKANVSENADCETAILELVEAGCHVVFTNSFGHEEHLLRVAPDYPDVQFCAATGFRSAIDDLDNTHNYFAEIHQARYLSGVVAGLKTESNILGYVAAKDYAEVISGYTAFYLGAKSVNPEVTMYVNYTNEWSDPAKEATNATALIGLGCDVIGQHSDTTAPATTAEQAGVFAVGYNDDMIPAAPAAALTSARINWGVYYEMALGALLSGDAIPQDWCEGLAEGAVYLSELNMDLLDESIVEAVDTAREAILDGTCNVFDGPLLDAEGNEIVADGEFFYENEESSAPSWDKIIAGVNVLS